MSDHLTISLSSENFDTGSAEERATFGLFAITANDELLTEGMDTECREVRDGPYVSGYPVAEWLAWNWWRIRWELGGRPHSSAEEAVLGWNFAHRMPNIGEGYTWPNVTIHSDGLRSILRSEPSRNPDAVLFRYFGAPGFQTVTVGDLEAAIDGFVGDVLTRLEGSGIGGTNLHRLWDELRAEREDADVARFRRLEARFGCDPDEADEGTIRHRLDDAAALGEEALGEVAADVAFHGNGPDGMMSADGIADTADRDGFDANPNEAVRLDDATDMPSATEAEAWRVGEYAARKIRDQEGLDGRPISDERLADLAGTKRNVISERSKRSDRISFVLVDRDGDHARVALGSKWETGRRFELARLVGDRLLGDRMDRPAERLFPATRAYSYRQKMQRAFAAELLSPFAAVDEMSGGDYSEDRQNDVAEHFGVSPMTIRTQLVDHGRIDREDAPDIAGRGAVS